MVSHTVGPMEAGKKVHRLVRQLLPGVPLSGIHKMLRVGRVRLNGKKAKPDMLVAEGDILELRMAEDDFATVSKQVRKFKGVPRQLDVVYEDDSLIAVNKPVGLLTHGTAEEQRDTLANRVLAYLYDNEALNTGVFVPAPANRLDRNTSGIILFGKTGDMARELADGFKTHTIQKWYLAVVRGSISTSGTVTAALARDQRRNITRVDEKSGKASATVYHPLATTRGTTVIRLELISGRTHQIRAHMQHIGHPLLSDLKYQGRAVGSSSLPAHNTRPGSSPASRQSASRSFRRQETSGRQGEGSTERDPSGRSLSEPTYLLHAGWVRLHTGQVLHAPMPQSFRASLSELGYREEVIDKLDSVEMSDSLNLHDASDEN